MTLRSKWQNILARDWGEVKAAWITQVPNFGVVGSPPNPGLEKLQPLLEQRIGPNAEICPDVEGLRANALWEAIFLFHKCAHSKLAAERIGREGMHSWALFNAYHSAFLGAKGIMALLGVAFPKINGRQLAIDLFPPPPKKKKAPRLIGVPRFEEFQIIPLPALDQQHVWEALQRVLWACPAPCFDAVLVKDLIDLQHEKITPPRNHFLYKAHYWPLADLVMDEQNGTLGDGWGDGLDPASSEFLLNLCFTIYRLFQQLVEDMSLGSASIKEQFDGSRCQLVAGAAELAAYDNFLGRRAARPPL